jgi:hypothetical protein
MDLFVLQRMIAPAGRGNAATARENRLRPRPAMLEPRSAQSVNVLGKECVIGARHSSIHWAAVEFDAPEGHKSE